MLKEKTATFIGHKDCYGVSRDAVRKEVLKLIENGVVDFLNGGMGAFDRMCAGIVFDIKKPTPISTTILLFLISRLPCRRRNTLIQLSIPKTLKNTISSLLFRREISTL